MQLSSQELDKLSMTLQDMVAQSGGDKYLAHALKFFEYKYNAPFVGQLLSFTPLELLRSHYIGKGVCMEAIETLAHNGLRVAALENYKPELLEGVWQACPKLPECAREKDENGVVNLDVVRARKAFKSYLLSLEDKAPVTQDGSKEWFNVYLSSPPVRGMLGREFEKSTLVDTVPRGAVGLAFTGAHPEPRMA